MKTETNRFFEAKQIRTAAAPEYLSAVWVPDIDYYITTTSRCGPTQLLSTAVLAAAIACCGPSRSYGGLGRPSPANAAASSRRASALADSARAAAAASGGAATLRQRPVSNRQPQERTQERKATPEGMGCGLSGSRAGTSGFARERVEQPAMRSASCTRTDSLLQGFKQGIDGPTAHDLPSHSVRYGIVSYRSRKTDHG